MADAPKEESFHEKFGRLQWEGRYEEAAKIERQVFDDNIFHTDDVNANSVRSSFYYSWAGNVLKRGGKLMLLLELSIRLWRFYNLMQQARITSDNMLHAAGFRHELTADQLDVRASIYLRLWNAKLRLKPEYYREVWQCLDVALAKKEMKPHTRALLLISRAKLQEQPPDRRRDMEEVEALVPIIRESGELKQLTRVYRELARYYRKIGNRIMAGVYQRNAEQCARESGATAQLVKMGVKA